jgi:hypothetical protein
MIKKMKKKIISLIKMTIKRENVLLKIIKKINEIKN